MQVVGERRRQKTEGGQDDSYEKQVQLRVFVCKVFCTAVCKAISKTIGLTRLSGEWFGTIHAAATSSTVAVVSRITATSTAIA